MIGTFTRNTEPHQKCSRSRPPIKGPSAPPAEKLAIHTPTANVRWRGAEEHVPDQRQRRRSEGRGCHSQDRSRGDQHGCSERERGEHRGRAERRSTDQQQSPPADPVPERSHRDEGSRDQEPVDVHDPEQLGAARFQVCAEVRHGEVQHRQVHRVEQARQGEHGESDPFPTRRSRRANTVRGVSVVRHVTTPCPSTPDTVTSRKSSVGLGELPVEPARVGTLAKRERNGAVVRRRAWPRGAPPSRRRRSSAGR